MQRFDSVREKDFNLHFCTRNRNYIQSFKFDCRNKGESLSFADCNSCNGLTLLERKISTSTSALETEIIFNLLSLTAEIKENHFHLHTLIGMLDWTFRARGLSFEFWSD